MPIHSVNFWIKAFIPNSACVTKGDVFVVAAPPVPDRIQSSHAT